MSQRASQGPSPARRKKNAKPHVPFTDDSDVGKRTGLRISRGPQDDDGMENFEHVIDRVYEHQEKDKDNGRRPRRSTANSPHKGFVADETDEPTYPSSPLETHVTIPVPLTAPVKTTAITHPSPSRRSAARDVAEYQDIPSPNRNLPTRSKSQPLIHRLDPETLHRRQVSEEAPTSASLGPQQSPILHSIGDGASRNTPEQASPELFTQDSGAPSPTVQQRDEEEDLFEADGAEGYDDGAEEEEVVPTRKRRHSSPPAKRKKAKVKSASTRQITVSDGNESDPDDDAAQGLRRGRRRRFAPLEYWRLEKVVYKKEQGVPIPVIESIIRVPKEPLKSTGSRHQRKRKATSGGEHHGSLDVLGETGPPEAGWDDNTNPMGVVLQFPSTEKEVERRLAFTAKMVAPREAQNASFKFQKIFGDGEFIASGVICIPPKGEKPPKPSKDNTYIFYCIEGVVQVKVHRTSFVIAPGGMFLVPRGNQYWIENPGSREAKLFFAQGRQVPLDEMESIRGSEPPRASSSAPRNSNRPL